MQRHLSNSLWIEKKEAMQLKYKTCITSDKIVWNYGEDQTNITRFTDLFCIFQKRSYRNILLSTVYLCASFQWSVCFSAQCAWLNSSLIIFLACFFENRLIPFFTFRKCRGSGIKCRAPDPEVTGLNSVMGEILSRASHSSILRELCSGHRKWWI